MLDDFSLKSWLYASGAETHSLHRGMQNGGDAPQRLIASLQHVDPTAAVPSPRVVLVGSQSSGKSSLVNALIGLPLLPTSEEMCTKVPHHMDVRQRMYVYVHTRLHTHAHTHTPHTRAAVGCWRVGGVHVGGGVLVVGVVVSTAGTGAGR